jgi:hypothetical protein
VRTAKKYLHLKKETVAFIVLTAQLLVRQFKKILVVVKLFLKQPLDVKLCPIALFSE